MTKAENGIDTSFSLISPPVNIGFPSLASPSAHFSFPFFNPHSSFHRRATLDRIEIVTSDIRHRLKYAFTLSEFIRRLNPIAIFRNAPRCIKRGLLHVKRGHWQMLVDSDRDVPCHLLIVPNATPNPLNLVLGYI